MVTDAVKLRKLTWNLIGLTTNPSGEPVLQTKGLLEGMAVFGRFLGAKSCQILPISAKNVQRTGANGHLRGGFSRPILLKRVKCRGSCQGLICGVDPPDRVGQKSAAKRTNVRQRSSRNGINSRRTSVRASTAFLGRLFAPGQHRENMGQHGRKLPQPGESAGWRRASMACRTSMVSAPVDQARTDRDGQQGENGRRG